MFSLDTYRKIYLYFVDKYYIPSTVQGRRPKYSSIDISKNFRQTYNTIMSRIIYLQLARNRQLCRAARLQVRMRASTTLSRQMLWGLVWILNTKLTTTFVRCLHLSSRNSVFAIWHTVVRLWRRIMANADWNMVPRRRIAWHIVT